MSDERALRLRIFEARRELDLASRKLEAARGTATAHEAFLGLVRAARRFVKTELEVDRERYAAAAVAAGGDQR